jgi:hypothetical protein
MSLFSTASILGLKPTQLPIKWVLGVLSPGIKRPGHEGKNAFMAWAGTGLLLQITSVRTGGHPGKIELGTYKTQILNVTTTLTCSAKGKTDLSKTGRRLVSLQKKGVNEWTSNQATSYFLAYNT